VPQSPGRFGYAEDVWTFGNCLPILALRDSEGWRSDPYWPIGDPFVSQAANYHVSLTMPKGYTLAASSPLDKDAFALRDWAMVIVKDYAIRQAQVDGVRLIALSKAADRAEIMLVIAGKALSYFCKAYGSYPWETLTLVETPFPLGGMEYPGLAILSDSFLRAGNQDGLELSIVHELAHQWFYALVGSDQIRQPWQDEALCEWATLRYVRAAYGQGAYENLKALRLDAAMQENVRKDITPASPLDQFQSYQEYTAVVYGRGAAMLEAIELDTGKADDFLKAYCQQYAFRLATRQDFEDLLNSFMYKDLAPLVRDYLDTSM
jgi:aminopeptidase N